MDSKIYEYHSYRNNNLPIIFHQDIVRADLPVTPHWHENIALLFVKEGVISVNLDDTEATAKQGEILVINSSVIHRISATTEFARYTCLIIDKHFCDEHGFYVDEKRICETIEDEALFKTASDIRSILKAKPEYYLTEVLIYVMNILITLFRNYISSDEITESNKNIEMIKKGIKYIKKHFKEQISIEEIADYAGYSKYYFCRRFKEITGSTVNTYINQVKIDYAYRQLSNTDITISDIAFECGFNDISYFTKIFKKYSLTLPSKVEKRKTKT